MKLSIFLVWGELMHTYEFTQPPGLGSYARAGFEADPNAAAGVKQLNGFDAGPDLNRYAR